MRHHGQLRTDDEARVDATLGQRLQLDVAGGFAQLQLHLGVPCAEMPQQLGQDAVVGRADEGQRQRAHLAPRQPLGQPRQRGGIGQHATHLGQPLLAGGRQHHGPARAREQLHADLLLQRLDLLRERRLGHGQPPCRAAEM
ncbi:hypothetical protein D3C81_1213090 [compost metagenome]